MSKELQLKSDEYWEKYKQAKDKVEEKYYYQWFRFYESLLDDLTIISHGKDRETTYKQRMKDILEE